MKTKDRIKRALRGASASALAVGAIAAIGATPAGAAFPGRNGQIAFTQLQGFGGQSTIGAIDPDGGGMRTLTAPKEGARQPAYSPDGRWIAYTAAPGSINRMLANGKRKRRLTPKPRLEDMPSFSPNGRRIAFVRQTRLSRTVLTINRNGRRPRALTRNRASEETPVYSPSGRWIAFVRVNSKGRRIIFRMRPNGRGVHPVAVGSDPAWSPNGRRLAYVREARGGSQIFTVAIGGRGNRRVTGGGGGPLLLQRDLHPEWSPDGSSIAFVRNNEEIRLTSPAGGESELLARVEGVGDLSWQAR